jgi:hypothetical protein
MKNVPLKFLESKIEESYESCTPYILKTQLTRRKYEEHSSRATEEGNELRTFYTLNNSTYEKEI